MPAVTRELSVIYGTITLGGSTDRIIDGPWSYDPRYPVASFECEFATFAATEAAFTTETAALEAGLRTPRQRLRVVLGAVTTIDLNPASGTSTGFNARPSLSRLASDDHTGRSARYRFRVEVDLPADLAGQSGRFDEAVAVAYAPGGRRTVSLRGQYRALTANDATAQYAAQIAGHQTTVLTAIDAAATWELVVATTTRDDTDKIIDYVRTIEEILLAQSASVTDDPDLFAQQLDVRTGFVAPGDSPLSGASRLTNIEVTYSAAVLSTVTDLRAKWLSTIRPWLIQHARDSSGASGLALVDEQPRFDAGARRISAAMRFVAQGTSAVVESLVTVEDDLDLGVEVIPTHSDDPLEAHLFQGPQAFIRTVNLRRVTVGPPPGTGVGSGTEAEATATSLEARGAGEPLSIDLGGAAGEIPIRSRYREQRVLLGLPGTQLELSTLDQTRVLRLVHAVTGAGATGIGDTGATVTRR